MASEQSVEVARKAQDIYEQRLRRKLEATDPGAFVAIEPESGEYFLGPTLTDAIQAARFAHPGRLSFTLRIGHKTTVQLGAWTL